MKRYIYICNLIKRHKASGLRYRVVCLMFLPLLLVSFAGCTEDEILPQANAAPAAEERSQVMVRTAIVTVEYSECFPSAYPGKLFRIEGSYGDYLQPYYATGNPVVQLAERYQISYKHEAAVFPFPGDDPETIYCQSAPFDMESNQPIKVLFLKKL